MPRIVEFAPWRMIVVALQHSEVLKYDLYFRKTRTFGELLGMFITFGKLLGRKRETFGKGETMRNNNYKGRCVKRSLPKFTSICKTYDDVQKAYADVLVSDEGIVEIRCNVILDDKTEGEFTSDFVVTKEDGTIAVRECVLRSNLLRPRTMKLLDLSQRYWAARNVTDWMVITDAEKE